MCDWPFDALRPLKYGAILADPPWQFGLRSKAGEAKSPQAHYATMTTDEICALPVGHLAAGDCMLFMWATWPMLPDALRVMDAWGFQYKTGGPWLKRTHKNFCFAQGTGYVLRGVTEPFLIGTIGRPKLRNVPPGVIDAAESNDAPEDVLIDAVRREHSRKPPEMRALIEGMLPDVFGCELFAREPWAGRDVWGNQTDKFAEAL